MANAIESIVSNAVGMRSSSVDRPTAVAAALELIAAKVANSPSDASQLEREMDNLSKYADQIQAALVKK
ncbi:hypothetical protein [Pseudomonas sp. B10(2017)]|uniref:hypothetical protein n=1 Tax=Pseudomonas sp. B10(2017) TaxID=1981749 RepID=UPI000A1FDB9C|nr:hypothetical protein [Pseudomonas sp. B10(2017)]